MKNSSAVRVFVCCSPRGRRRARRGTPAPRRRPGTPPTARTSSTARGSASRRGRATARRPACGRSPSGENLSLSTKIGPRIDRSSSSSPRARASAKNARCSLENSLRSGCSPDDDVRRPRPRRARPSSTPSRRSRRASRRPRRRSSATARSSSGSSAGTTGRSFTTESSPLPWTRRARTTTPRSFSARSGVSKKKTWRIWASSGSSPSAATAERWSCSRHGQLQLDAVRLVDQSGQLRELFLRECRCCGLRRCHRPCKPRGSSVRR